MLLAKHADFHIIKIAGFESAAVAESPGSLPEVELSNAFAIFQHFRCWSKSSHPTMGHRVRKRFRKSMSQILNFLMFLDQLKCIEHKKVKKVKLSFYKYKLAKVVCLKMA